MEAKEATVYDMDVINKISYEVVGAALKVHSQLGPGLLESVYEVCLIHELVKKGYVVESQRPLPVVYDSIRLNAGFRIDLLINGIFVVEIKSVDALHPIHTAQLLTYLRISGLKLGLLINFNVEHLKEGIKRIVNSHI
jgi:GxxExxY protein